MRNRRIFYILGLATLPVFFASCSKELELEPQNDYLTQEQVRESSRALPDRGEGAQVGLYAELKKYDRMNLGAHADFGIGSIALMLDSRGDGLLCNLIHGYNKYLRDANYKFNSPTSFQNLFVYQSFYAFINASNNLLESTDPKTESPIILNQRAQAKAFRAWGYMNLVQLYQYTYIGNEDKLGVPIVTEGMTIDQKRNNPRKTVKEVYDFIETDLNEAYEVFKDMEASDTREYIDKNVTLGLLARMYLLKGEWQKAADAATAVIKGSNTAPLSKEEAGMPNFDDGQAYNMIWASVQTPEDRLTTSGLLNFQSMMCSLSGALTYSSVAPRRINPELYLAIDDTDVRKGWWVVPKDINIKKNGIHIKKNVQGLMNFLIFKGYPKEKAEKIADNVVELYGIGNFVNVKFAPADKDIEKEENSSDFPLMRIEEMYYILAEAKGRLNLEEGKALLKEFVVEYRQSNYKKNMANLDEFIDEIYRQRRIEFWGEMISFYDMLRLKKPMTRIKDDKGIASFIYAEEQQFNLAADDPRLILQFPERELSQNTAIEQNEYKAPPSTGN